MSKENREHTLRVLPGGKDKANPLDQHFEKLLKTKWFRIILFMYLLIAAGGFPALLCLHLCHHHRSVDDQGLHARQPSDHDLVLFLRRVGRRRITRMAGRRRVIGHGSLLGLPLLVCRQPQRWRDHRPARHRVHAQGDARGLG